ncbi:hypothetical protein B0J11DRAFT_517185 [Dendryphion nanum]|uniref:Uncharacterized protein n=1 Tax=Dendryphion nanum TaxID=256645 RepID=A0A9P9ECF5_9PLEO|nr:hypothetical protein B0J11DRAFT_517185 [Dendryphion nanum]
MSVSGGFGLSSFFLSNASLSGLWQGFRSTFVSTLDYERCASLHNKIVEIGWERSGRDLKDLEKKNWFERYGEDASSIRSSLSSDLVAFLERTWAVDSNDHSFFYYVWGLQTPKMLTWSHQTQNDGAGFDRFVTLYSANNMVSHYDGLVFDQLTNKAIMQMSIFDSFIIHNRRQSWYALEVVLDAWLDMIKIGKVEAVRKVGHSSHSDFPPWIIRPYSELMLQETIDAFNALVDAIESRMSGTSSEPPVIGILDQQQLKSAKILPGFAHDFFLRARRPRFRYVAPGLLIPSQESILSQPFFALNPEPNRWPYNEVDDPQTLTVPPVLLFASTDTFKTLVPPSTSTPAYKHLAAFGFPFHNLSSFPAGLYLSPADRTYNNVFEDSVRLVLPYTIGIHGFARTSDGARFGENTESENVEAQGRYTSLYQQGYNPFIERHDVRLVTVLKKWTAMVEKGLWGVGREGVKGGMGEWKRADMAIGWKDYVCDVTW